MSLIEKIKAGLEAARRSEGKTKVKGTMSSEVDGRSYTSKGVVRSKPNNLNNTTKTITKLKGRGYDTPILRSRQVVVKNADGTVKRTGSSTKFKKGYEAKPILSLKTKPAQELPTKKMTPEREKPKRGKSFPSQQYPNSKSGYINAPPKKDKEYDISGASGQTIPNSRSGYIKSMEAINAGESYPPSKVDRIQKNLRKNK